jgi:hypothetical protein
VLQLFYPKNKLHHLSNGIIILPLRSILLCMQGGTAYSFTTSLHLIVKEALKYVHVSQNCIQLQSQVLFNKVSSGDA